MGRLLWWCRQWPIAGFWLRDREEESDVSDKEEAWIMVHERKNRARLSPCVGDWEYSITKSKNKTKQKTKPRKTRHLGGVPGREGTAVNSLQHLLNVRSHQGIQEGSVRGRLGPGPVGMQRGQGRGCPLECPGQRCMFTGHLHTVFQSHCTHGMWEALHHSSGARLRQLLLGEYQISRFDNINKCVRGNTEREKTRCKIRLRKKIKGKWEK